MKILAIMQNMWVRDPERTKVAIAKHGEEYRRKVIRYALFAGCRTGRVLKQIFGDELCEQIIWDESTREIAGDPRKVFPPDVEHIRSLIETENPDVLLIIGKVALEGVIAVGPVGCELISMPHPCARGANVFDDMRTAKAKLDALLAV